jgi:hypothetical protein
MDKRDVIKMLQDKPKEWWISTAETIYFEYIVQALTEEEAVTKVRKHEVEPVDHDYSGHQEVVEVEDLGYPEEET